MSYESFFSTTSSEYLGSTHIIDEFNIEAFDADRASLGIFEYEDDALNAISDCWDRKHRFATCGDSPTRASEEQPPPQADQAQLETFVQALFKHATAGTYVSLRTFPDQSRNSKPFRITPIKLNGNLDFLIKQSYRTAELAANDEQKLVFCPPIATFTNSKHAGEQDLAEGLVLSTECDEAAAAARVKLEAVLGLATVVVASGGEWTDSKTGEVEPKLHIHHRLKVPTRSKDEHRMLKEARRLAAMLVGADKSNVPICHPIRWPGSLHRKKEPKLCRIVACNPDAEIDLAHALMRLREAVEAQRLDAGGAAAKSKPASPVGGIEGPPNPNNLRAPCIEAVIGALAIIPNDDLEWDEWNYVGLAICGATGGSDEGGEAFASWSAKAKKNDPATTQARWEHYRTSPPDRIGYGTLVYLAREVRPDWEPPPGPRKPAGPCTDYGADAPIEPPPITWNPAELKVSFSNIPHRQWIYGSYLIRGEVTIVASPGGVGKTALITGMATEISIGIELLEERIWGTDLKVLSFNGEDGTTEVNRRMWAFSRAHAHQTGEKAPERLYALGTDDVRVQQLSFLRTNERNASLLDASGFKILESALEAIHPDVLILDPLVAFCAGGNMNDNSVMALVMRELKRLAVKFNCAILIVHHTKKGGERGDQEAVSGAAAIVNVGRRALMPVPMALDEAQASGVLPSERFRYFKLVDAKTNLTPRSADSPWYALHNVELPNAEPPIYPHGDNVQAVVRATLPLPRTAEAAANDRKIQKAILDLIDRGKFIEDERYPYSPNITGAKNMRALLADAMTAVTDATVPRQWRPDDLRAVIHAATDKMKVEGWLYEEKLKSKRFHGSWALFVDWAKTPWSNTDSVSTGADVDEEEPASGDEQHRN